MTNDSKVALIDDLDFELAKLNTLFFTHPAYDDLRVQFEQRLKERLAVRELGIFKEPKGIVLTGGSGSGKTTAVNRLRADYPKLRGIQEGGDVADFVSLRVPSPATLKRVGFAMLRALGYPLERDKPAAFIWDQVRVLLAQQQTTFVHLDEAQDLLTNNTDFARRDVVNTLKSLMNDKDWPVVLLLSGTQDLVDLINSDRQLARRVDVIRISPITFEADGKKVRKLLEVFTQKVQLEISAELSSPSFLRRLVHASGNEFGLMIHMILSGIDVALRSSEAPLKIDHFAKQYFRAAACHPEFNPFLAEDFEKIDVQKKLLSDREQNGGCRR